VEVFNLEVGGVHDYLVSATWSGGVVVHNGYGDCPDDLFEIVEGVRRSKAAVLNGNKTIMAEVIVDDKIVGVREVHLSQLRSPNKSSINVTSSSAAFQRWQRVYDGTVKRDALPVITVRPGSRGISIFDVDFE